MTPEAWTVIGVGVAMASLGVAIASLVFRMDSHVRAQGERLARVEGLLEGLRDAITGRDRTPSHNA